MCSASARRRNVAWNTASSTPAVPSSPATRIPTAISTSLSTPEEVACEFIGHPSLTECRSILKFDSYGSSEVVNGTSIPSEIGLLTQLTALLVDGNELTGRGTSPATLPPSTPALPSSPATRIPTAISTSLSTPEEVACEFIGHPSLTECRSILKFDSYGSSEVVNGTSIPSEIGLLTQLTALLVDGNELTGSIPSEISLLTDLVILSFTENELSGTIPSSISMLTKLTGLWLDQNKLTGGIPSSLSSMTSLIILDTSHNELNGPIPSSFSGLTSLTALDFFQNELTGTIPSTFSQLTNLMFLEFHNNSLTGSIPPSLASLTLLTRLSFSANELTGTIPASLCTPAISLFIDCGEIECDCCSDRFSESSCALPQPAGGTSPATLPPSTPALPSSPATRIPTAISTSLSTPEEVACEFIGHPSLTECRSILKFDSFNDGEMVTGSSIPSEIGLLTQLTALLVDGNELTEVSPLKYPFDRSRGTSPTTLPPSTPALPSSPVTRIPTAISTSLSTPEEVACAFIGHPSLTECLSTFSFDSYGSNEVVNGTSIPSEIGLLSQLTALLVDGNELTGSIPSEISLLTDLVILSFTENELSGTIPSSISMLTKLTGLWLDQNKLTGGIPSSLSSVTSLIILDTSHNELNGPIPSSFSGLTSLTALDFFQNELTGTIPSTFSQLTNLMFLEFHNNSLIGSIPPSLSTLTLLTVLSFSANELTGGYPNCALYASHKSFH
ncbi:hypothetical protein MHU86_15873 [Fragilaria crotonensis]|nr:hypothetical protein MHU86_15873 [Fragilaria crotonensis]